MSILRLNPFYNSVLELKNYQGFAPIVGKNN